MKSKRNHDKRSNETRSDDEMHGTNKRKKKQKKPKYRHKNAWLEEDDDYLYLNYREEEE